MLVPFGKARARHLRLGSRGENAACDLLKSKGMVVLVRNYRCTKGEIDIVARDGAELAFIEVKSRSLHSSNRPATGLRSDQKYRISRAGRHYLYEIDSPRISYRFDLIEVVFDGRRIHEIRYWQRHFEGFRQKRNKSF